MYSIFTKMMMWCFVIKGRKPLVLHQDQIEFSLIQKI